MVQEAYDVLSDAKKRQMYDQYGFYSENIPPGGGRRREPGPQPNMDFGGFDFSDFSRAAQPGGAAARRPPAAARAASGISFRSLFNRGEGPQQAPEKGADLEYSLNIDFWQAIKGTQARLNITRYDICPTCHGSGSRRRPDGHLSGMQRHRLGLADGRRHALQPDLSEVRRQRQAEERLPHLPGRRPHRAYRDRGCAHSAGSAQRLAAARAGQGQRGHHGRAFGRSLHHHARGGASVLSPRGRRYRDPRAGNRVGSRAGRQDRSAHHRRPHAAEDPAGHAATGRSSGCGRRASSTRAPTSAATRLWKSPSRRPRSRTNAPKKFCASWPRCIRKIRARIFGRNV